VGWARIFQTYVGNTEIRAAREKLQFVVRDPHESNFSPWEKGGTPLRLISSVEYSPSIRASPDMEPSSTWRASGFQSFMLSKKGVK